MDKSKSNSKNDSWVWIAMSMCFFIIPRIIKTEQPNYFARKYATELADIICLFHSQGFSEKDSSAKSWELLGEKYGISKIKYSRLNTELFASTFKDHVAACGIVLPDPKTP